jgi:hypothetical protein
MAVLLAVVAQVAQLAAAAQAAAQAAQAVHRPQATLAESSGRMSPSSVTLPHVRHQI